MLGEPFYSWDMKVTPAQGAAAIKLAGAIDELNNQIKVGLQIPVAIGIPHAPGILDDAITAIVENQPGYRQSNAKLFPANRGGINGEVYQEEDLFTYEGKDLRFGREEFRPETGEESTPVVIYTIAA